MVGQGGGGHIGIIFAFASVIWIYFVNVLQVLSELLADLDACDSQKDAKLVANGEVPLGQSSSVTH